MMGGYPPGLPPLQGPVDGLVSMSSMQPLHPGGPPPHHLPPGVPGLPGMPPPGKNFILTRSLILSSCSLFPPSACCPRRCLLPFMARPPSLGTQGSQQQGLCRTLKVAQHCALGTSCLTAAWGAWQRASLTEGQEAYSKTTYQSDMCSESQAWPGRAHLLHQWAGFPVACSEPH